MFCAQWRVRGRRWPSTATAARRGQATRHIRNPCFKSNQRGQTSLLSSSPIGIAATLAMTSASDGRRACCACSIHATSAGISRSGSPEAETGGGGFGFAVPLSLPPPPPPLPRPSPTPTPGGNGIFPIVRRYDASVTRSFPLLEKEHSKGERPCRLGGDVRRQPRRDRRSMID